MESKTPSHFKIILSIFLKDLKQALVDRTTLGVMIGVLLLILPSQLLPLILRSESVPQAVILNLNSRSLLAELSQMEDVSIYPARSFEDFTNAVVSGRNRVIGLVFPDNFSNSIEENQIAVLGAYFPHWSDQSEKTDLMILFEQKISQAADQEIEIRVRDDQIHPDKNTRGAETMFILQMINAIMTVALVLVPQLIMREKEKHTLDALLVSPASYQDIVIGKGLTGMFYSSLGAVMVILMNQNIIAHGWVLLSSAISGIVHAVLLGLLIGLSFDNFQQATLTMSAVVLAAMAPAFISILLTVELPAIIEFLVNWSPSGKLSSLILMSLQKTVPLGEFFAAAGFIWGLNLLLFGLCLWQVRKHQR